MKKELRQALGPLFQTPLGKNDYIVERKPASIVAPVYPGEIMFVRDHASCMRHIISVVPDQKRHAFFIEIGWAADGKHITQSMRPSTSPQSAISNELRSGFVRLSEIFDNIFLIGICFH